MDSPEPVDDERRASELVAKHRDKLVALAKQTMLAQPGMRIAGVILDRALPIAQDLAASRPPTQEPATAEVVGIVPRAWALQMVEHFNAAASEWFPSDGREGDHYRLPVVLGFLDGPMSCVITWPVSP